MVFLKYAFILCTIDQFTFLIRSAFPKGVLAHWAESRGFTQNQIDVIMSSCSTAQ